MPREEFKRKFIRFYLEAKTEINGDSANVTDEKVEEFLKLSKPSEMVIIHFWIKDDFISIDRHL